MAIEVETKDCTALTDAELEEMADICTDGPARYGIGILSKQREQWVLVTRARNNGVLQGFSFSTLERIGGTPAVLIGMASIKRTAKRTEVLKALMLDELRRAVMAFPAHAVDERTVGRLKSILQLHPGPSPVLIELGAQTVRLSAEFNVDETNGLRGELLAAFGPECVRSAS